MVNYKIILFIYSPVLLLILINLLRDKFEPQNNVFRLHNWSLMSIIIVIGFFVTTEIIRSFWSLKLIPVLKNYEYNPFNWDIFALFWLFTVLGLIYLFLPVYKVSVIETFNIKSMYFPFIFKLCIVLTVINILTIYFLDENLIHKPSEENLEVLKSMDTKRFILYSLVTIVVAPIVEETIFRGLIYAPLYRKVGRCLAIILSSLIWTHVHFQPLLQSIGIFVIGVILAWLYDRRGSLLHPIVFHMFRNSWGLIYYFGI